MRYPVEETAAKHERIAKETPTCSVKGCSKFVDGRAGALLIGVRRAACTPAA
jgi:hypothetical protein